MMTAVITPRFITLLKRASEFHVHPRGKRTVDPQETFDKWQDMRDWQKTTNAGQTNYLFYAMSPGGRPQLLNGYDFDILDLAYAGNGVSLRA